MRHIYIKITAYVLALVLISGSLFTALSLTADAKASRDLYGTGSADDIDITKLLDMALNKGGMSMSPSTIKAFLEYWWDSVASDLNTCIGNASSTITTTQDFANYIISALDNAEHYDRLGEMMKRYVQYVLTMGYKSLSDFKQLLTQEGTFRKFLLSYVVDEDGNIANTVNNKLKKYSLKSGLVNMVREAADAYIEEYEGYWLIPSFTYKDLSPSQFPTKTEYDCVTASLKTIPSGGVFLMSRNSSYDYFMDATDDNFVANGTYSPGKSYGLSVNKYDSNWTFVYFNHVFFERSKPSIVDLSKFNSDLYTYGTMFVRLNLSDITACVQSWGFLFTLDGRTIKVWKSLDALKNYSVGKSNIYYSNTYSSFDNSVDNSVTFTGQYYTSNAYSHTTIQNNIDNSQEINETTVNNIVNNYITNNYYGTDNPGGGGDDPGSSGNWFTDLITGIPQLLAALVDGLADLVEAGGKLVEGIVNLFTKLFVPSEGFADPLIEKVNEKFTFKEQSEKNINLIFDQFSSMGQSIPTLTFPFSKTSLAKYGVGDYTVSFDWYAPYKPSVDVVFSAILWVMFAFNQYFAVKNIINASGSAVDIATRL